MPSSILENESKTTFLTTQILLETAIFRNAIRLLTPKLVTLLRLRIVSRNKDRRA